MITNKNIDLDNLTNEQLIEIYAERKDIRVAHQLWCRTHIDIPINFSNEFVKLLNKFEVLNDSRRESFPNKETLLNCLIDSIYVDCRGLFCESPKQSKNYTLQNCLKISNLNDAVDRINEIIIEKDFKDELVRYFSFWGWVKLVTDKSIAHKDQITEENIELINYRHKFLLDPDNAIDFQLYIFKIHEIYVKVVNDFGENLLRNHSPRID
ncbi:hypothetical protein [Pantoea agglomerans]|uniref:hypothetical protein n=1 Tax=Enterobacter agglomerans TaxID=549 RepID=UPI0021D7AC26